jgi:hypothetical protein
MPTTPISVSTGILSVSNTTIYTVPAGRTAIVKAISGVPVTSGNVSLTVSKNSGGQNYVVVNNQASNRTPATGGTETFSNNVLQAPLTLGASEQLKVYTSFGDAYSLPSVSTAGTTAADGSNYTIGATLFANGIYMGVGNCTSGAYVATSTDAITWTQRVGALPFGSSWNMLCCNGSVWVAANKNSTQGTVYYSSDNGVTWGAAVVVSGAFNCNQIVSNGSLFFMNFNNGKVYSSSNGSTWTESTSYYTAVGSINTPIYNVGWTGSHWLVNNQFGCLASADLTTWFGYAGASLGRNFANMYSTEYSSAYGKFYTSRNDTNLPNIFSSSSGLLWENIYSGAFTPYKVNCAGSNTVLIAVGSSGTTAVLKSTDGSTWATATVQGSYAGPMWGLENGYYFTMLDQASTDACMISTDPTVSTGTTRGNQTSGFICRNAAADPVSGKWVGVGDEGTNIYILGGTSGTNIGTTFNPSLTVGAAGTPVSVCWSAADGYFYMITTTGRVYKSTAYNSTWTFVVASIGSSSGTQSIKAVGTTLYVVSSSQTNTVWISSTLTGGASWTQFNYASPNGNAYKGMATVSGGGYYNGEALATDGTNLVWNNTAGNAFALTPSVSTSAMRMPIPKSVGTAQTVNGNTFLYGAYDATYGPVIGYFTSTNVITTYGSFISYHNTGTYWMDNGGVPNKVNYVGGSYYVTSTSVNGYIWNSTTPTTLFDNTTPSKYASIGTSYAGITAVNPSNGWMIDGTNLVGSPVGSTLVAVCKTATPSNFLYAATVTASIVEIS